MESPMSQLSGDICLQQMYLRFLEMSSTPMPVSIILAVMASRGIQTGFNFMCGFGHFRHIDVLLV